MRLVGFDGQQLGILPTREALRVAQEQGMDLVEVAPTARPPVCRIMDYGKYKYEQSKRERETRKKQRIINVKEVKLRLNIDEHDFQVKARNAIRFLEGGDKVKVTIMFRGREISHSDLGMKLCQRMASQLADLASVERPPRAEGRNMTMFLVTREQAKTTRGDTHA